MNTIALPYAPHPGQQLVHTSKARFRVLNCGRRWGKTLAAIWECLDAALANPEKIVWYIGPTYKQSKPVWRLAKRKYPQNLIKPGGIKEVEKEIHLVNDAIIEFKSADDPDDLRSVGEDLVLVVFDECAFLPPSVWTIMRPALMDNKTPALLISTPKGRNWFYSLWLKGQKTIDGHPNPLHNPDWESWKFSSYDNPHLDKNEIDELIREEGLSPLEIAREIYADFVEAAGYVFPLDAIEACINTNIHHSPEDHITLGIDIARVRNFTVIVAMNQKFQVVAHKSMQGPWSAQAKTIAHFWRKFNKPTVVYDATGVGDAFKPLLIQEGVFPIKAVDFRKEKQTIIENLKVGIEERIVSFPKIPQLLKELQYFEAKETPSGKIDYSAPRGIHDDYVMALALAYWGASKSTRSPQRSSICIIGGKKPKHKPYHLGEYNAHAQGGTP